jgi:hypothetical protein
VTLHAFGLRGLSHVAAATVAIVLLGYSTVQASATAQTSKLPNVVFVGDSITHLAAPSIQSALGSRFHTVLVYRDGQRIDQMLPSLDRALTAHAPVFAVVEDLGTNDALQGGHYVDWHTSWRHLMADTAHASCVVLVTVNPTADYIGGNTVASSINRQIRNLATTDPSRYKLVPWAGFLALAWKKYRSTFFDYMYRDLIHEPAPGARWLAEEDGVALANCGSAAQPSMIPPNKRQLSQ